MIVNDNTYTRPLLLNLCDFRRVRFPCDCPVARLNGLPKPLVWPGNSGSANRTAVTPEINTLTSRFTICHHPLAGMNCLPVANWRNIQGWRFTSRINRFPQMSSLLKKDAPDMDRTLVSVHFPKASGTSLRSELFTAFGEANVFCDYASDPVDPDCDFYRDRDRFMRTRLRDLLPYKAVHGHLPIIKYDLLPAAYRVVMLREPVENLISIYCFWRSLFDTPLAGHSIYQYAKAQRLSLLELAEIPRLRWLMSRSYFGGFDMRRFDIIGSYDKRIEFFTRISTAIGKTLHVDTRENATAASEERNNVACDTKLIARLRYLLQDDIRLYELHTRRSKRAWLSKVFFVPVHSKFSVAAEADQTTDDRRSGRTGGR